jgi:hypothetical protein
MTILEQQTIFISILEVDWLYCTMTEQCWKITMFLLSSGKAILKSILKFSKYKKSKAQIFKLLDNYIDLS